MFDTPSSEPLNVQLTNYMREKIYSHEWGAGEQIPTEMELVDLLGASRGTIKKAISVLVDEGLLVQTRGRGTFVTKRSITHPTSGVLLSFGESLRRQGIDYTTKVLREEVVPADEYASGILHIAMGAPTLRLDRVRAVGGEPIIYFESLINLRECPGLEKIDFERESLFGAFEKLSGKRIGYSHARYAAMVAGEERGRILEIESTAPVLHLNQLIYLVDDTPLESSNVWLRANRYVVGAVLQRV